MYTKKTYMKFDPPPQTATFWLKFEVYKEEKEK